MKAGRELDRLVAEKVMKQPKPPYVHTCHIQPIRDGIWVCHPYYERGDECAWEPIPFSTDIAAAWQVVERLCNWDVDDNMLILKGQGPDIEREPPNGKAQSWWDAEINGTWGKALAEAPTAPHAICLAALKAIGVDIE